MGYIQIDTISVVERAHHHSLWTRRPDYLPAYLHELQANDRRIFEYWAHEASYIPIRDYRFYRPLMRHYQNPKGNEAKSRMEKHAPLMRAVLKRIREEGPLSSKDFKGPEGQKRGAWWDWKPTKLAMELLFWRGELMITERRNFQRIYDLRERVLPGDVDTRMPDEKELGRFLVRRALEAYGVATTGDIRSHLRVADKGVTDAALKEMLHSGEVIELVVRGDAPGLRRASRTIPYYALPGILEQASQLRPLHPRVRILSPFDNLVTTRKRILGLFDFDYTLECFTPAVKRKYGYFSLPVLWGERFAARLDAKANRKEKTLVLRYLVFEDGVPDLEAFLPAFAAACSEFARFNRCDRIVVEKVSPSRLKTPLRKRLRSLEY